MDGSDGGLVGKNVGFGVEGFGVGAAVGDVVGVCNGDVEFCSVGISLGILSVGRNVGLAVVGT